MKFFSSIFAFMASVSLSTGPLAADALEEMGAFKVYSQDISIPTPEDSSLTLTASFYAPSNDSVSLAEGSFPLVVMTPGFLASYTSYERYSEFLASHGVLVVGMDFGNRGSRVAAHDVNAKEISWAIDYALSEENELAASIDSSAIIAAGHSLGGKIAFYAAVLDPRIQGVMAMDPSNAGGPPCFIFPDDCRAFPVAPNPESGDPGILDGYKGKSVIFRAKSDLFNPEKQFNAVHFWNGLQKDALYYDFDRANHASFASRRRVIDFTKRTMIAWINKNFLGLSGMETYLTGEIAQKAIRSRMLEAIETK